MNVATGPLSVLGIARPFPTSRLPRSFVAALLLGAGFFAFVAWDQSYWWRTKEDYGFGWLVPLFVAYVVHERWPRIRALASGGNGTAAGPMAPTGEHGVLERRAARIAIGALAVLCALWGVLWFLLGAFYRASAGPSNPGTLAITMGAVCIVAPLLYFESSPGTAPPETTSPGHVAAPATTSRNVARGGGRSTSARLALLTLFTFPLLVWLVSAPLVSVVESALSRALLHFIVTIVRGLFDALELPIAQRGNVLVLPRGEVGVAEACSGIRSLTGCLFAGSFLAATLLTGWWRKGLLLVLAFLLAIVSNLCRAIFLTTWAYRHGAASIEGTLHDATGYAVLGLTTLLLLAIASRLGRIRRLAAEADHRDGTPRAPG